MATLFESHLTLECVYVHPAHKPQQQAELLHLMHLGSSNLHGEQHSDRPMQLESLLN